MKIMQKPPLHTALSIAQVILVTSCWIALKQLYVEYLEVNISLRARDLC